MLTSPFVFTFRFGSIVLVFGLCCVPGSAYADWLFGGYMGMAGTSSNTLTVTPAAGAPFTLDDVAYKGQAFRSPWYYGVRVGVVPRSDGGTTTDAAPSKPR